MLPHAHHLHNDTRCSIIVSILTLALLVFPLSNASAQSCEATCKAQFDSCSALAGPGCNLAGEAAGRATDRLLGGVPGGALISAAAKQTAQAACEEKLAPCRTKQVACLQACTGPTPQGTAPVAAGGSALATLLVYASEPGAVIYVDQQRAGVMGSDLNNPVSTPPLLAGNHTVRVAVGKGASERYWEGPVSLKVGTMNTIEVSNLRTQSGWQLLHASQLDQAGDSDRAIVEYARLLALPHTSSTEQQEGQTRAIQLLGDRTDRYIAFAHEKAIQFPWTTQAWGTSGVEMPLGPGEDSRFRAATELEVLCQALPQPKVQSFCADEQKRILETFENDAHEVYASIMTMNNNLYRQAHALRAWQVAFVGAADAPAVEERLLQIEQLRVEHVVPLLSQQQESDKGSRGYQREMGGRAAKEYQKLSAFGLQTFLEEGMVASGVWVPADQRTTMDQLWASEQQRRLSSTARGWAIALTATSGPIYAIAAAGGNSDATPLIAGLGVVGLTATVASTPLQMRHLQTTYGELLPTEGKLNDNMAPYLLIGMENILLHFIMTNAATTKGPNGVQASDFDFVRNFGYASLASGAGILVYRSVVSSSPGTQMSVQLTPTGISGHF